MQELFTGFSPTTAAQWKEQLIKDLKGIDYASLVWNTNAGIDVQPFYTAANNEQDTAPAVTSSDWAICEFIRVDDEKEANTQALNALQNGASGLVFYITRPANFPVLLKGISIEHIYSLFMIRKELEGSLLNYLRTIERGSTCFIESDNLLSKQTVSINNGSSLCVNISLYQEAGANTVHELACALAHINEYLHAASSDNLLEGIKTLHINLSVGGDFFMEIAKLRALRKLAVFLLSQYNSTAEIHINAQTTFINKSSTDRYNNMLRSTTEAMSAAIGGANSILVLPFDIEFNPQSDFSSRMARNQQLILKDESYLNKVADISAGSYYIENLTQTLCEKAWDSFKLIESKGGLCACLNNNYIQDLIAKDAENLIKQFKEGKLVLVGVNKFQNKNEVPEISRKISVDSLSGLKAIHLSDYVEQAVN